MLTEEFQLAVPWGHVSGKTWGYRSSIPVLMVHGHQDNAGSFDNLIPLLPQHGFCYICIDLPGHGKSSHFPHGFFFTFINYVETVRRIIDYLKLEKVIFIGHSLGGHFGVVLTSAFPEKIIKLVTIDSIFSTLIRNSSTCKMFSETVDDLYKLEQRLITSAPEYSYDEAIQRIISGRSTVITEEGAKILAKRSLIKTGNGFRFSSDQRLKVLHLFFSFEQLKNFIDNIKRPFLIILARESIELSKYENIMEIQTALFKDLKHCIRNNVEGNHNVHIDNPERVAPIISEFLLTETSRL